MTPRARWIWILLLVFSAAALAADPVRKPLPWEKPRQLARHLFLENCSVCHDHAKPKSAKIGPSLVRFKQVPPERVAPFRQYIMTKIRAGGVAMPPFGIAMPSFKDVLSEDQIAILAGYLLPESNSK